MFKNLALLLLLALPLSMQAQTAATYPNKPIRIIVPNAAGGAADITSREVGRRLADGFHGSVIVDNKPGAGGIVAGEQLAKSAPDGYTLLLVSSGTAVSSALFKIMPFDPLKDFAPVSKLAIFDLVIAVPENSRFHTLAEALTYAHAHPGKLNIGTPQIGTTQNLAAELFKTSAGIDVQIVPFNGTPPVMAALRGGQIDMIIEILGPLAAQFKSKEMRLLATMGDKRNPQFATTPTVRESGGPLASFNATSWNGFAVPAKTPKDVIAKLNAEIQKALKNPDVIEHLALLSLQAQGSTPEQLGTLLAFDTKRWSEVIARAKIPKQ